MKKETYEIRTDLEAMIYDLIATEAIRFDIQRNDLGISYLRLTSTRELLANEIRDDLLNKWQIALNILSQEESIKARFDFSTIQGLAICQSDWGFDCDSLTFKEDHHEQNTYRW